MAKLKDAMRTGGRDYRSSIIGGAPRAPRNNNPIVLPAKGKMTSAKYVPRLGMYYVGPSGKVAKVATYNAGNGFSG